MGIANDSMWPLGTLVRLVGNGSGGYIPFRRHHPYSVVKMLKHGSMPFDGTEGIIVARCREPGWYMVQYKDELGNDMNDVVVLAFHKRHFKKMESFDLPNVTWRSTKRRVGTQGIQVGDTWVRAVEDKAIKK